jgi:hypothetical protein
MQLSLPLSIDLSPFLPHRSERKRKGEKGGGEEREKGERGIIF